MAKINPNPPSLTAQQIEDFWSRVDKTIGCGPQNDCWIWKGIISGNQACFSIRSQLYRAHRISLWLAKGLWYPGRTKRSCGNNICVNPNHVYNEPQAYFLNEKRCSRCKETKPLNSFYKNRTHSSRHASKCKDCSNKDCKTWYEANKSEVNQKIRKNGFKYRAHMKSTIIQVYSNGTNTCACCGESNMEFLTIDHINGNGRAHRKSVGNVYQWLCRNNFPAGFRVLCMNCNFAYGKYRYCPHDRNKA